MLIISFMSSFLDLL